MNITRKTEEFYENLKNNYFFNSKIKNMNKENRNIFISNNIKNIYNDIFFQYKCKYSDVIINYRLKIFFNKINKDFILYLTKDRYYTNSKYLSNINDYYTHIEYTSYNITIYRLNEQLELFKKIIQKKPYVNKDDNFLLENAVNKCNKIIKIVRNKLNDILSRLPLDIDCNKIIISYLI